MKKLFFTMLCLGIITFSQAQIQKNDKFLYFNAGILRESSPILKSNYSTQIPTDIRYGHAFSKQFLAEMNLSGFGLNTNQIPEYSYFDRSGGVNLFYVLGKKRLQPYVTAGLDFQVNHGVGSATASKIAYNVFKKNIGVGAFYFFKPALTLNSKLQYSSIQLGKPFATTNSFLEVEVELLNVLKSGKQFFTKESDSERFLSKGKTAFVGKFAYRYGLSTLRSFTASDIFTIKIDYERMLSEHFFIGLKSDLYANELYDTKQMKAHLGFYGKIGNSLYAGTSIGLRYVHNDYNFDKNVSSIVPTANLLYFMNSTTAIVFEIEHSGITMSKLGATKPNQNDFGANIGLKYFLK